MIMASLFSVRSIVSMQGYAKLINYLGIVRGCGQRIAKLEVSRQPKDNLISYVDGILSESLRPAKENTACRLFMTRIMSKAFQNSPESGRK